MNDSFIQLIPFGYENFFDLLNSHIYFCILFGGRKNKSINFFFVCLFVSIFHSHFHHHHFGWNKKWNRNGIVIFVLYSGLVWLGFGQQNQTSIDDHWLLLSIFALFIFVCFKSIDFVWIFSEIKLVSIVCYFFFLLSIHSLNHNKFSVSANVGICQHNQLIKQKQ